jgi:hypothetical protein
MDKLFTLRIALTQKLAAIVTAYDGNGIGRERIDIEVTLEGEGEPRTIFPKGSLYLTVPILGHLSLDSVQARELVLSAVGMQDIDTDKEWFEDYTPEQLEFSDQWGQEIRLAGYNTYCDEDGNALDELDGPDPLEIDA